jgi:hypothetical protein
MNDDRRAKRRPQEQAKPKPAPPAAQDGARAEPARKPSPIEPREWRGAGVCGDRHTD